MLLAYIGASFLLVGLFFVMISVGSGPAGTNVIFGLGLFVFMMGFILGILTALDNKKEEGDHEDEETLAAE
jgi:hypothetical protein